MTALRPQSSRTLVRVLDTHKKVCHVVPAFADYRIQEIVAVPKCRGAS
eukprot:SAG11_NODE_41524_length_192_cov_1793.376344_1_plen_47_part_01